MNKTKRFYIIYDSRAAHGMGTKDATVICTAETLKEAKQNAFFGDFGSVAVYSYSKEGKNLVDEQFEFNTL